jgi:hypothetical protein
MRQPVTLSIDETVGPDEEAVGGEEEGGEMIFRGFLWPYVKSRCLDLKVFWV